jgi:hypothetical protein
VYAEALAVMIAATADFVFNRLDLAAGGDKN